MIIYINNIEKIYIEFLILYIFNFDFFYYKTRKHRFFSNAIIAYKIFCTHKY